MKPAWSSLFAPSRALRSRGRRRLQFELLETRLAPDTKTFAGLDFTAAAFQVSGSQVATTGAVTVAVARENAPLLRLSGGVSFQSDDATGSFTPAGTVSALVAGQSDVGLLNGTPHAALKASDLLGSGATIAATETKDVSVPLHGESFTVGSIKIGGLANAHVLQLAGKVALTQLGGFSVPLPAQVFLQVDGGGPHIGTDFDATLPDKDKSFDKGGLTVSFKSVEVKYSTATKEFDLRGTGSFKLTKEGINTPIALHIGDPANKNDFGIQVQNGTLTHLDLAIDNVDDKGNANTLTIRKLKITPQTLHITYDHKEDPPLHSGVFHDVYMVTGAASFSVGTRIAEPVTVQLGSPAANAELATQGIIVTDGALTSFDMHVVNGSSEKPNTFTVGKLAITPQNLHVSYAQTTDNTGVHDTYTVQGGATFALPKTENPVVVQFGSAATSDTPATDGIVITDGDLTKLDLVIASGNTFTLGKLAITPQSLHVTYDHKQDPNQAGVFHDTYKVIGGATFTVGTKITQPVGIQLGSAATNDTPATQGIVVVDGVLTTFDMTIINGTAQKPNTFTVGKLAITPASLHITYSQTSDSNNQKHDTYTVTGGASFTVGTKITQPVSVLLGSPASTDPETKEVVPETKGLVVTDGKLTSFDLLIDNSGGNSIKLGDLALTPHGLHFVYQETTDDNHVTHDSYTVTGSATLTLGSEIPEQITVKLGTLATDKDPETKGLIVTDGNLSRLDLEIDSTKSFTFHKLTITPSNLHVIYDAQDAANTTFALSGGLALQLDAGGQEQSVSLALVESGGTPGLVIQNGKLTHLNAQVSADFNFKVLHIGVEDVKVLYDNTNNSDQLQISGGVTISTTGAGKSFVNISAHLGEGSTPGLVISNGVVQSVHIVVSGGFSLYGLTVSANNLTVDYQSTPGVLQLAGGLDVNLTEKLGFGATLNKPVVIDLTTGDLSIDSGLDLSGELQLGPFAAHVDVSYMAGATPGAFTLHAHAKVHLPRFDVDGTLNINNGVLTDIALSTETSIPIPGTGLNITAISGGIFHLDDTSKLTVTGSLTVVFGTEIEVAGSKHSLFDATGSFEITPDSLHLEAHLRLVDGLLGDGNGSVDINWTKAEYKLHVDAEIVKLFRFSGDLFFNNAGDITLNAMADIHIPDIVPFVGGTTLGSVNVYLQVRPELHDESKNFVAAWTTINLFGTHTIGFQVDFLGHPSLLDAPPAMTPVATTQIPQDPYRFQYPYSFDVKSATSDPGVDYYQITVTSDKFAQPGYNGSNDYLHVGSTLLNPERDYAVISTSVPNSGSGYVSRPGGAPNQRVFIFSRALLGDADAGTINLTLKSRDGFAGAEPSFGITTQYLPASVDFDPNDPLRIDGNGNLVFGVRGSTYGPDWQQKAKIDVFYTNASDPTLNFGTLAQEVTLGPNNYDTSTGNFSGTVTWNGFADLAPLPYDQTTQYHLFAQINDGHHNPRFSGFSNNVTPPNPAALPALFTPGPAWVEPTTDQLSGGLLGVYFAPFEPANLELRHDLQRPTHLKISVDHGGFVGMEDPALIQSATLERDFPNAAQAEGFLSGLEFVAAPDFTGLSTLTITATTTTATGKKYTRSLDVPIVQPNAHLVTTQTVEASGSEGEVKTIILKVENQDGPNALDATNVRATETLPVGLTFIEAQPSVGSYDAQTGLWSVGDLPRGQTRQITILARINAGTQNSHMILSGAAQADQLDVYPADATGAVGLSVLSFPLFFVDQQLLNGAVQDSENLLGRPTGAIYPAQQLTLFSSLGGPYKFQIIDGALPHGLTLSESGVLSGTATESSTRDNSTVTFTFSVAAQDRIGTLATGGAALLPYQTYTLQIADDFGRLFRPYSYDSYSQVFHDRFPQTTYVLDRGSLPPGLALDPATGRVSGVPTTLGFFDYYIRADSILFGGLRGTQFAHHITQILPGEPLPLNLFHVVPFAKIGEPYDFTFRSPDSTEVTNPPVFKGPVVWTVAKGALPPGLSLDNSTGRVSGTPTGFGRDVAAGFIIHARDNDGLRIVGDYGRFPVDPGAMTLGPASLPNAAVDNAYRELLSAGGGGGGPYAFSATGNVPDGLTLDAATGIISGSPTRAGTFSFSVTARDINFGRTSPTVDYTIRVANTLAIQPEVLPTGVLNVAYPQQLLHATGGSGTGYTFSITKGGLPLGLSLAAHGSIAGTPTVAGSFAFTVTISDGDNRSADQDFTSNVASFAIATVGSAYQQGLPVHHAPVTLGGPNTFVSSYALTSGFLGAINLSGNRLVGTPSAPGFYPFTIRERMIDSSARYIPVTDYYEQYFLWVDPAIVIGPATLPRDVVGNNYQQTITAQGGSGKGYTFAVTAGSLPAGLSLDSATGLIHGKLTTAGFPLFTVTASDDAGGSASRSFFMQVQPAITLFTGSIPTIALGGAFGFRLFPSGGAGGPYTFTVTGTLPSDFVLTSDGFLTGEGNQVVDADVSVSVADVTGNRTSVALPLSIVTRPELGADNLDAATQRSAYSQPIPISGGKGPYNFVLDPSTPLPAGLTLSPQGLLSGTPGVLGNFSFKVTATDSLNNPTTATFHLTIQPIPPAPPSTRPISPPSNTGPTTHVVALKPVNRGLKTRRYPPLHHMLTVPAVKGLLQGIIALDHKPLRVLLAKAPRVGKLTIKPNGAFTYVAPKRFKGVVSFQYRPVAGTVRGDVITVMLTVK